MNCTWKYDLLDGSLENVLGISIIIAKLQGRNSKFDRGDNGHENNRSYRWYELGKY